MHVNAPNTDNHKSHRVLPEIRLANESGFLNYSRNDEPCRNPAAASVKSLAWHGPAWWELLYARESNFPGGLLGNRGGANFLDTELSGPIY